MGPSAGVDVMKKGKDNRIILSKPMTSRQIYKNPA
jgi:hypothetical protein